MVGKVLEIDDMLDRDSLAENIAYKYEQWNTARNTKKAEWKELRNYVFATDTTTTSNSTLPWKNKTTTPKLTQIRDNLHASYMQALFPNDQWFTWEGAEEAEEIKDKRDAILAYMRNKARQNNFETVISKLLYDYIDYGNAIGDVEYVQETFIDNTTGEEIQGYVGPRAVRISPLDIVINPTAQDFESSPKITRYLKNLGELKVEAQENPDLKYNEDIIAKAEELRQVLSQYDPSDYDKTEALSFDGFGSISDYFQSGLVEIIEFEGNIHTADGELKKNRLITVIDRSWIVRDIENPSWTGRSTKVHAGWRPRPDNIWAMGPLDNLVGLQYRIDHLENIKADLFDLIAHPPLKIRGEVREFEWAPFAEIILGEDGDVDTLKIDAVGLTADQQIEVLMNRMERMAGSPEQSMGIRSPGEKTLGEVQLLDANANKMFLARVRNFEINILEPLLNNMLAVARRNIQGSDLVRVMDDDFGVVNFLKITKEDITAAGKLRPIGSRHWQNKNQMLQNLGFILNGPVGQMLAPHISKKALGKLVENALELDKYGLISENAGVMEDVETQRLVNEAQQQLEVEQATPIEE